MERPSRQHAEVNSAGEQVLGDRRGTALDRDDLFLGTAVGLAAAAIFLATLAPGLLQDDSAEMQTLAVTLGYAHPTGSPVYLLIAKAATWLPVGEIAYRVNLLSAVMGGVAAGLTYVLARLLTGGRWIAVAAAAALAVSPTFWSQAVIAEVYTCGAACMLGVLIGMEVWRRTGRLRWLFAAACLGGVSLGVHATVALTAPACLLLLAITRQRWKLRWATAVGGACTGVAITLAAYAVIDRADSRTSYFRTVIYPSRSVWNLEPEDMDGYFDRVRLSMRAPQFADLLTSQPPAVTRRKTINYAINLTREFPWPWLLAAAAGVVWLGRRNLPMTLVLALSYVTHLCYTLQFDGVVHVLYIATYVPIAVLGAAGLAAVVDGCRLAASRLFAPRSAATDFLVGLIGLGVVAWPLLWTDAWKDGRRAFWLPPGEEDAFKIKDSARFHREATRLIQDLEPRAIVFTGWCTLYPYYYVAREQDRPDLDFFQDYPHPGQTELADSALEYVEEVSEERPVYFTHYVEKVGRRFELRPVPCGHATLFRVGRRLSADSEP